MLSKIIFFGVLVIACIHISEQGDIDYEVSGYKSEVHVTRQVNRLARKNLRDDNDYDRPPRRGSSDYDSTPRRPNNPFDDSDYNTGSSKRFGGYDKYPLNPLDSRDYERKNPLDSYNRFDAKRGYDSSPFERARYPFN